MIVAFTGTKGSGKDTAGAHLIKQYEFERRAFADPLKKAVAALFNIPFWEIEQHKNDDTVHVAVGYKNKPTFHESSDGITPNAPSQMPDNMWSPISSYSFREMLQRFGTEMGRDVFGTDFWVDLTLPVGGYYAGRKIVITDCRFQNEVDRIHEIGGMVCRIIRPDTTEEVSHASEATTLLKGIDYEIGNDTTMSDFLAEVDTMLDFVLS